MSLRTGMVEKRWLSVPLSSVEQKNPVIGILFLFKKKNNNKSTMNNLSYINTQFLNDFAVNKETAASLSKVFQEDLIYARRGS